MGSQYNGNGCVPQATNPLRVMIASSTNATPIKVTTSTPHGYATGDTAVVEGHLVNTAANGRWQIIVLDALNYTLTGSVGIGVGGASGYSTDYSVNPVWTLPAGGDLRNAGSVNSPMENTANMVPYLFERVGNYRSYTFQKPLVSDAITVGVWSSTSVPTDSAWHKLTSTDFDYNDGVNNFNIDAADILTFAVQTGVAGLTDPIALAIGLSANNGSTWSVVPGSVIYRGPPASTFSFNTINAMLFASELLAGNANPHIKFCILCQNTNGTVTVELMQPYHFLIEHFRSNLSAP